VLADQLRLEGAVAIAGRGDGQLALVTLHGLPRTSIAPVRGPFGWAGRCLGRRLSRVGNAGRRFAAQMDIHLAVEHPLQGRFHHQPHQAIEVLRRLGLAGNLTC